MKGLYNYFALIALVCFTTGAGLMAQNSVPYIDTSFNHTGSLLLTDIESFTPLQQTMQPDGKLLVSGYGADSDFEDLDGIVYRINPDGSLDPTFGDLGLVRLDIEDAEDAVEGLELLPNGQIMVMLASQFRIVLIRLNANGTLDATFGTDGAVIGPAVQYSNLSDLVVQNDGKCLVIGTTPISSTVDWGIIRRFNSDGSPDLTYGLDGETLVLIDPSLTCYPLDGLLQPDGKLLLTGIAGEGPTSGLSVFRLNTDGSLDNSFSDDGRYFQQLGNSYYYSAYYCLTLGPTGTIYVGGVAPTVAVNEFSILALKSNGTPETGFGTNGYTHFPSSPYFAAVNTMYLQADGKLMIGGYGFVNTTTINIAFARLKANGTFDTSFGTQGKKMFAFNLPYKVQIINAMSPVGNNKVAATIWLNETTSIGQPGNHAACMLVRYVTDITSKAEEPSPVFLESALTPNLVVDEQEITVQYSLEHSREVGIVLYDMDGMEIRVLSPVQQQAAGKQSQRLQLPELPAGMYFVTLSAGDEYKVLKLIKQ